MVGSGIGVGLVVDGGDSGGTMGWAVVFSEHDIGGASMDIGFL